jgi:hypothetical protein
LVVLLQYLFFFSTACFYISPPPRLAHLFAIADNKHNQILWEKKIEMADENDLSAEQTSQLAHFQEIVGIDSLDECRQILEVFEWNIEVYFANI